MPGKPLLYLRTVPRIRPRMFLSRFRHTRRVKGEGNVFECRALALSIPELDRDAAYATRFDLEALSSGDFLLINECHHVNLSQWQCPKASHLWNFNLHYFEYCVPLAARYAEGGNRTDYDLFKTLVVSWIAACTYPEGDAWHPYTISLRLINWLICVDLFGEAIDDDPGFKRVLEASMHLQYRHLLANQEIHLMANHYWENLKTLVIMALHFGESNVLCRVERLLIEQLNEQVLPDGVHYERSMMYHKLVLEGLLRVELAYRSVGFEAPHQLANKAKSMLDAVASLERGMGKTLFFNDAADGVAKECEALVEACEVVFGINADTSLTAFPDSGFYKLYDGDAALVFFAGEPGPPYMLGHAHCDLLSFELSVSGMPAVVNSGTYAYQSELRSYFRSTAAHNTCQIDDCEQMECWSEHRVARGVRDICVNRSDDGAISARFADYLGNTYERVLRLFDGQLSVEDSFDALTPGASYLHLAPGVSASKKPCAVEAQSASVSLSIVASTDVECALYFYSPEFGRLDESPQIVKVSVVDGKTSYRISYQSTRERLFAR